MALRPRSRARSPLAERTRAEAGKLAQQIRFKLIDASTNAGQPAEGEVLNYQQRLHAETDRVLAWLASDHRARISVQNGCTFVKIRDLLATSTGGTTAALRNWCNAAERRARAA